MASRRAVVRALGASGVTGSLAALLGWPRAGLAAAQTESTTTTQAPTTTTPASTTTTEPPTTTTSTTIGPKTTSTAPTTTTTLPAGVTYVRSDDVRLPTGNVKHFGAKGDGSTDDTAAIQAAIDAAYLVYFPAGTYTCMSTLFLRNGSRLLGEARGQKAASGSVVQLDSRVVGLSAKPAAIKINAGSSHLGVGVTIENLWIKGIAASSPDYGYARFPSYGIYAGTQTNGLMIRNVTVTGFTVNVALIDATYCKIDHSHIARAVNTNLLIYGLCQHVKVMDSELVVPNERGTAHASALLSNVHVQPRDESRYPRWVSIQSCLIDEVAKNGQTNTLATVRIDHSTDVNLDDCIIYTPINGNAGARPGGGYGLKVGSSCERVALRNVRIQPYELDSNHVPLQTILIDAGAIATSLTNVTTVANGGGDIADVATDTQWTNVNGIFRHPRVVGERPSATVAGAGAVLYDAVLAKPLFSDGTVWRDASGAAV